MGLLLAPLAAVLLLGTGTPTAISSLSLGYAALMMGLTLELLWLTGHPSTVAAMSVGALMLSVVAFFPFRGEGAYSYGSHLEAWPLAYAGLLLLLAMIGLRKKLVVRLDEGTALLHSIVFLYWMLDAALHGSGHWAWIAVAAVPLAYSALNAWTELELSRSVRLGLSLWSSLVMLALAVQTAASLYRAGSVESFLVAHDVQGGIVAFLSMFLLGTSSAYMVTNATMLLRYLPSRSDIGQGRYLRAVAELSREHVARFSARQVALSRTSAVVAGVGAFLGIHAWLRMIPTSVALWLVLTVVPWTVSGWEIWRGVLGRGGSRGAMPH